MLTAIKQRVDREDDGFTLIELMVVVLIIAILLAIAIPTFLGARNTANARAAQSNLRNTLTAEQTQWTNSQAFSQTPATMAGIEQALTYTTGVPSTGGSNNQVALLVGDTNQAVIMEAEGKDNNCYYIMQSDDPTNSFTYYGEQKSNSGACTNLTAATFPTIAASTPAFTQGSAGASTSIATVSGGTLPTWYTSF